MVDRNGLVRNQSWVDGKDCQIPERMDCANVDCFVTVVVVVEMDFDYVTVASDVPNDVDRPDPCRDSGWDWDCFCSFVVLGGVADCCAADDAVVLAVSCAPVRSAAEES